MRDMPTRQEPQPVNSSLTQVINDHGLVGGMSTVSYPRPEWMTDEDYLALPLRPDIPELFVKRRCANPECFCQQTEVLK